jgi:hypothetical protein
MGKKKVIVWTLLITAFVVVVGAGWLIEVLRIRTAEAESEIMDRCDLLWVESRFWASGIDKAGLDGLIEAIEVRGDNSYAMVEGCQAEMNDANKEKIAEAMQAWEKAKEKLEELRISYETRRDPNAPKEKSQNSMPVPNVSK